MAAIPASYEGNEPYIFISYAHKNSDKVLPIIDRLERWGFRVWYDAGIEAGTEWPEYIASRLQACHCVIAFLSQEAVESTHCRQEITFAVSNRKEMLAIHLEDLTLPGGLQLQLGNIQAIFYNRSPSVDAFVEQLIMTRLLQPCCAYPERLPKPKQAYSKPPVSSRQTVPSHGATDSDSQSSRNNTYTEPKKPSRSPERRAPRISIKPKFLVIAVALIAAIVLVVILLSSGDGGVVLDPAGQYDKAMDLISQGSYYEAYEILQKLGNYEDSQVQLTNIREKALVQKISTAKKGEVVVWGNYEQNNDTSDGKEPIEWFVLHAENGRVLLLSKKGLDCLPYHEELKDTTWARSDLRAWLNDEFYYEAFTEKEQAFIPQSLIVTEGSADTRDYVFLLSDEEAVLYDSLYINIVNTDYAIHNGAKNMHWWLRSPWNAYGTLNMDYAHVSNDKISSGDGITMYHVDTSGIAVRPAIWIDTRDESDMESAYNNALSLFSAGQYKRALTAFQELGDYKDSIEYCARLPKLILMQPYAEAKVGDTVTMGDHDWIVLDKQEDRILVLCKYSVGTSDYHKYTLASPGWDNCTLRTWLNADFFNSKMNASEDEKSLILSTQVSTPDNPSFGTTGGATVTDRIFLLSHEELTQYLPDSNDRYFYKNADDVIPVAWWLRTKGSSGSTAVYVDKYGAIDLAGASIFQLDAKQHVRPAMWIKIVE